MLGNTEYKRHYKEFSQNVAFAARTWHHHVHLNNRAAKDEAILAALNKAPRFWLDLRYSSVQTTIIFLGKIFDNDGQAFNVDKTIKSAHEEIAHFSKDELRKRKVESAGEFEGLDEYIKQASELDADGLKAIRAEIKNAKKIWEKIKPLRDKIYAHSQIMSNSEREELYKAVKNDDIDAIIQILLNVSEALLQAEINGRKPDFSSNYTQPIEHAQKDIEELIGSLLYHSAD
ncbi:MAG: hypothetical protein KGI37_10630 [Alphaproteobacteria bacterium]|nr:hypothetical protein [Alphaproteobacteria bacterium]